MNLTDLLKDCGQTEEEVYQYVKQTGVKGKRGNCEECVFANLLSEKLKLKEVQVFPDEISWTEFPNQIIRRIKTTPAIKKFVLNFDSGFYPDLVLRNEQCLIQIF